MQGVRRTSSELLSTTFRAPSSSSRFSNAIPPPISLEIYSWRQSGRVGDRVRFVQLEELSAWVIVAMCMSAHVFNWEGNVRQIVVCTYGYRQVSRRGE